jgi:hypothetical protein
MMQLPGGISTGGSLKRSFSFKLVTGLLELALSECAMRAARQPALTHPEQVTDVLCETLEMLADEPVSRSRVKELCVGDRQFLMRHLAIHIDDALVWLAAKCGACGESFDVSLRYSELPVKHAGTKFPETVIKIDQGKFKVRVPNGLDQEYIAAIDDDVEATHVLLQRLTSSVGKGKNRCNSDSDNAIELSSINKDQIALIEETVEQMAPEIATEVLATCPHCDIGNRVPVSPYACMEQTGGHLFSEVHTLASSYHWSEREILAMPRDRRHMYLGLIDHGHNMNSNNNI